MPLTETINDITGRLRQGAFPNEQAISMGVVLRVLHELGWNTWDPATVWPEYQTGSGRADFALCHPASKPAIFIEVKQPGRAEDGVRQALEYAFHAGVPFIVLTDGRTWSFYLPAEQGSYEDRRVYKLDLFERPPDQAADTLGHYLLHARVSNGEALEAARREYRSRARRDQAKTAIPAAWRELVTQGDELLIDLLADAVESKSGIRPEADDIAAFLSSLTLPPRIETIPTLRPGLPARAPEPAPPPRSPVRDTSSSRAGTLTLRGVTKSYSTAMEALHIILTELARQDPSFLERLSRHPAIHGRKRSYVARSPEELYPGREHLREMHEQLPGGWLVATNINNVIKKNIILAAAECAGLTPGVDITLDLLRDPS